MTGFAVALLVWTAVSMGMQVFRPTLTPFFPSPVRVFLAGNTMLWEADFWLSMLASNLRVLAGFGLGAAIGIPCGLLLGSSTTARLQLGAVLDFGRYLPVPALVPPLILWFGVGDLQKVIVLFIGTVFQLIVLVADASRRVPLEYFETARSLGVRGHALAIRVRLPAASPAIFDACRVAIGLTWSYLVVAEIVAANRGLGYAIIRAQRFLQVDRIFFTIAVLGLLGLAYDRFFVFMRGRLFPWLPVDCEDA